ncbi:hypothetical protein [Neglectibacter timonensis]|uniref:hypothetical protein n=1 Tax=Neglectibacter timonensis TaxID=1776382 RepID=UPI00266C1F29|nr:hypothetical protein [Neglectibacter timonensis]
MTVRRYKPTAVSVLVLCSPSYHSGRIRNCDGDPFWPKRNGLRAFGVQLLDRTSEDGQ